MHLHKYLNVRKQILKIGHIKSNWLSLKTGVPQGSVTGPLLFNAFINNLIISLKNICEVYNYADDNTLSVSHSNPSEIKYALEHASHAALTMLIGERKCYMYEFMSECQYIYTLHCPVLIVLPH